LVKESYFAAFSKQQPRQEQGRVAFANPAFGTQLCVGLRCLKPWVAVNQTACKMKPQETWTLPRNQTGSKSIIDMFIRFFMRRKEL